jgi:hypothetical protein
MDSPTDSSIDDLAASATVKTFGDIRYVTPGDDSPTKTQSTANARRWLHSIIAIPDVETLSESGRIAVLKKAEYGLGQTQTISESQANATVSADGG